MQKFRWIRISSAALAVTTLLVVGGGVAAQASPRPVDWSPRDKAVPVVSAPVDSGTTEPTSLRRAPVDW